VPADLPRRDAILIVARFTKGQCQPCPARAACTTSGDGKRTVGFPPRELYELQVRNRADQQTVDAEVVAGVALPGAVLVGGLPGNGPVRVTRCSRPARSMCTREV